MKIELNRILRKIPNMDISFSNYNPNKTYDSVQLIYIDTPLVNKDIIYVGSSSMLTQDLSHLTDCCLIIRCKTELDFSNLKCDYILLNASSNIIELYETMQGIWDALEEKVCFGFYKRLINCNNIDDLVAMASKEMDCPILITDDKSQLIAYAGSGFMDDPAFSQIILTGCSSLLHQQASAQEGVAKIVSENAEIPTLIGTGRFRTRKRIISHVMINDVKMGIVLALQNDKTFTAFDLKLIASICDAVSTLIVQSAKSGISAKYTYPFLQYHLLSLLNGNFENTETLEKWAMSKKNIDNWFWVFVIDAELNQSNDKPLIETLYRVCTDFHSLYCHYEGKMVILLNTDTEVIPEKFKVILTKHLSEYCHYGGYCESFSDLCELKTMYHQAHDALIIGKRLTFKDVLVPFSKVKIYRLLIEIESTGLLRDLYDKSLDELQRYDRQRGTQYYETLYTYLKCACNRAETAKSLYLHRNTVAYQLKKIEEILSIDLGDGDSCQQLYLSYKINGLRQ